MPAMPVGPLLVSNASVISGVWTNKSSHASSQYATSIKVKEQREVKEARAGSRNAVNYNEEVMAKPITQTLVEEEAQQSDASIKSIPGTGNTTWCN